MIKLLHAADLHLDSPFAALPPEVATQRRREARALLGRICRLADARGCQLLLLAGDILDSLQPYPETLEAMYVAFSQCHARVFIAPGNHDYWLPGGPWSGPWPEHVHVFTSSALEAVPLPELGCTVYGAAFTAAAAPSLLEGFSTTAPHAIGLLHGDATQRSSAYNPVTPEQLAGSGLQYVALGHIHSRSGLLRAGGTCYAWPGCPEGRGFDECGEKGVLEICLGEQVTGRFLPLPGNRYAQLQLAVAGDDVARQLLEVLPPSTALHARVTLVGSGCLDVAAVQRQLAGQYASLELVDQLVDRSAVHQGLHQPVDATSLRGLFLGQLQAQWQQTEDPAEREIIEEAARLGLAALEGREVADL